MTEEHARAWTRTSRIIKQGRQVNVRFVEFRVRFRSQGRLELL
jgi:hypothetical protein